MDGTPEATHLPRLISAGGVVLREVDTDVFEVVLCRHRDGAWFVPKGTPREGESLGATAVREVAEETGLDVRVVSPIGAIDYQLRDGDRWRETTVRCRRGDLRRRGRYARS